jgi:hypothetical protein
MVETDPVVQITTSMVASRVHIVRKNPYLLLLG